MRLSFHVRVEDDLIENALYYEGECKGLGDRFISDYEQVLAEVERFPLAWPMVDEDADFRRHQLTRFPYAVITGCSQACFAYWPWWIFGGTESLGWSESR